MIDNIIARWVLTIIISHYKMSLQEINHPKVVHFRELMGQLFSSIKQEVKRTKLEETNVENALAQDTMMDPSRYLKYILLGLSNPKTKQTTFAFLQKIYSEDGAVSHRLPSKQFIPSILKVCENQGGSLSLSKFLRAFLTNQDIRVSNEDKEKSLLYLLSASRNKILAAPLQRILLDVFSFLAPRSEPEIKTFLAYYINWIVNEVDLHAAEDIEYTLDLHKHQNLGFAYGRCFMCKNIAKNYHKELKIPICSIECKEKFVRIEQKAENRETFNLFDWLIEQSVHKDKIIFKEIEKELRAVMKNLTQKQLRILFPELLMHAKGADKEMALLCHRIFVGLFHGHKQLLKKELGSYVKEMISQLELAREPSQVFSLLQLFQELYKQPDNISWIYANFDCKYYEVSLLEDQLSLICKISIGEDVNLSKQAKICLKGLLQSLIEKLRGVKINDVFEDESLLQERKVKQKADQGIRLFNSKPKVGIQYLKENYLEGKEMTVHDLAKFIRQNESTESKAGRLKLKKDKIGEFFQENKPYNIEVYQAFLELLDFEGLTIDDALRELLSHFALGKEAQQIQRVVDYFSQRFFPYSGLKNVNSCFILSYTVLMLQSNLHNAQVKEKMTLVDFSKLCSTVEGINREGVQKIYESIKNSQLSDKPQLSSEYVLEKAYLNAYEQSELGDYQSQTISLLNSIWQYIYVGLVDRKNIEGLEQALILYGGYNMVSETEGFLRYLTKLAEEGQVEAYDVLLRLAAKSINSLGVHFHLILKFVFQMQEGTFSYKSSLDSSIVDMIFTSTATLSDQKFIQLLHSFCKFAYSNINDIQYSRELFVLKHLIEIVDYNTHRISRIWPAVWRILQDFFIRTGLHPKQGIAMAAVDSLKQIILKLIKLPEEPPFEQKNYMSPLLDMFDGSNILIKQLIVSILGMCVGKDLKSGWDIVFQILQKAENEAVIKVIHRIVETGLENVIDKENRLHNIIINKVTLGPVDELSLDLLIRITQFFSTQQNWIQSLRTIKNKFKATLSIQVLRRFFSILNLLEFKNQEVFEEIQELNLFTAETGANEAEEVFAFTNQIKHEFFQPYHQEIISLWDILLSSANKVMYLKYFQEQVLSLSRTSSLDQLEQTYIFLIGKLNDTNPKTLLEIQKLDPDFEKVIQNLPSQETGTDLIELDLEKEFFYFKAMLHVVVLETLLQLYESQPLTNPKWLEKMLREAEESHDLACSFNRRVLLRLFLWKNGFFKSPKFPGLLKQEILSLNILTLLCTESTIELHSHMIINNYIKLIKLQNQLSSCGVSQSLKQIYKEQLTMKIYNMKGVLIRLLNRIGNFSRFNKPQEMYDLVLDLIENLSSHEIIRAAQGPLQMLLSQMIVHKE